ncbi:hypothetical protein IMY05_C1151001600 [Salix suchowensis]|nr:hypothetical protein IMY05_C1151001600 [Salix suchowensis]
MRLLLHKGTVVAVHIVLVRFRLKSESGNGTEQSAIDHVELVRVRNGATPPSVVFLSVLPPCAGNTRRHSDNSAAGSVTDARVRSRRWKTYGEASAACPLDSSSLSLRINTAAFSMPTRTTRATDDDKDQLDVAAKCAADADEANARYDPIDKGWRKGEATTLVPLRRWEAWLADKGFAVGPSASATGMPRYTREHRQARRMLQNEQRHRLDVDELYRVLIRQQMEKQAEGRSAEPENDDFAMGAPPGAPSALDDGTGACRVDLDFRLGAPERRLSVPGVNGPDITTRAGLVNLPAVPSGDHCGAQGRRGVAADGRRLIDPSTFPPQLTATVPTTVSPNTRASPSHHHRDTDSVPYRHEDVALSLQLLAYLSKYPHVSKRAATWPELPRRCTSERTRHLASHG